MTRTREFDMLLNELAHAIERELGITLESRQVEALAERVRQPFAGCRITVPTRPGFVLGTGTFDCTGGVRATMERYQVSRSTVYRHLKK